MPSRVLAAHIHELSLGVSLDNIVLTFSLELSFACDTDFFIILKGVFIFGGGGGGGAGGGGGGGCRGACGTGPCALPPRSGWNLPVKLPWHWQQAEHWFCVTGFRLSVANFWRASCKPQRENESKLLLLGSSVEDSGGHPVHIYIYVMQLYNADKLNGILYINMLSSLSGKQLYRKCIVIILLHISFCM